MAAAITAPSPRPFLGETRVTHVIFPRDIYHHGILFGGGALAMMDRAAFIAATPFYDRKGVTRHLDAMEFTRPIPQVMLAELVARVIKTGRASMTVRVELFVEDMYSDQHELACADTSVLVALSSEGTPTPVVPLLEAAHAAGV